MPRICTIEQARHRPSDRRNLRPTASGPTPALRPRPANPHRSRPPEPFLPAVSSLGGFRTPAPAPRLHRRKGPASKTLHQSTHSSEAQRTVAKAGSSHSSTPIRCWKLVSANSPMWGDTHEGRHILIAVARYLAAHSPTERAVLQTADIARRLMRSRTVSRRHSS
jgi:hypothetical protein